MIHDDDKHDETVTPTPATAMSLKVINPDGTLNHVETHHPNNPSASIRLYPDGRTEHPSVKPKWNKPENDPHHPRFTGHKPEKPQK